MRATRAHAAVKVIPVARADVYGPRVLSVMACVQVSNNKTSIFTESPAVAATYSARCSSAARPQSTSSGVHKLDLPFHLVRPPSGEPTAANGECERMQGMEDRKHVSFKVSGSVRVQGVRACGVRK